MTRGGTDEKKRRCGLSYDSRGPGFRLCLAVLDGGEAACRHRQHHPKEMRLLEQTFLMELRIQKPHGADLDINGLSFDLEINGQPFAAGSPTRARRSNA